MLWFICFLVLNNEEAKNGLIMIAINNIAVYNFIKALAGITTKLIVVAKLSKSQ